MLALASYFNIFNNLKLAAFLVLWKLNSMSNHRIKAVTPNKLFVW